MSYAVKTFSLSWYSVSEMITVLDTNIKNNVEEIRWNWGHALVPSAVWQNIDITLMTRKYQESKHDFRWGRASYQLPMLRNHQILRRISHCGFRRYQKEKKLFRLSWIMWQKFTLRLTFACLTDLYHHNAPKIHVPMLIVSPYAIFHISS